jgi:PTS system nitrogen regulatory IIA component
MEIKDFLPPTSLALDMRVMNKKDLLRALAAKLAPTLNLSTDYVASTLERRDELGSTGFGGGVAIPHARLPEVTVPHGYLVRLSGAIDYNAIDGQPVDLVFVLLLPLITLPNEPGALASVARKFRDPKVLRELRLATSKKDLYRAITA